MTALLLEDWEERTVQKIHPKRYCITILSFRNIFVIFPLLNSSLRCHDSTAVTVQNCIIFCYNKVGKNTYI